MRSIAIGVLATFGLGCANTLPVYLPAEDRTDGVRAMVEEAGAVLGLQVHFVGHKYGAVVLDVVDRTGHIVGHSLVETGCMRVAWALAETGVVAHELGHVLGLEHVGDEENVMYRDKRTEWVVEEWQLDVVERQAARIEACRVEVD